MLRLRVIAICIVVASVARADAQAYDESRVKAVVAKFLRLAPSRINWLHIGTLDTGMGQPAIVVDLPAPADSHGKGVARGICVEVASRGLYVQSVMWLDNVPPGGPKRRNLLSVDQTQAMAERLARRVLSPWPSGMRLTARDVAYSGQENPSHDFVWEEWDGIARTGTRVFIGVNPCPPGSIYMFLEYLAPKHSVSEVKITREQAIAAAIESLRQRGAENPRVWQDHADLYLSQEWLERPHWWIGLDYDNRHGGHIQDMLIDAGTGEEVKPAL